MIIIYNDTYSKHWPRYFEKLDNTLKVRVANKTIKILEFPKKRHLKHTGEFFVDEVGQYRIVYRVFDTSNEVRFYFVGNHKEYEKWYNQFF